MKLMFTYIILGLLFIRPNTGQDEGNVPEFIPPITNSPRVTKPPNGPVTPLSMDGVTLIVATLEKDVLNPDSPEETPFNEFTPQDYGLSGFLSYSVDIWLVLIEKLKFTAKFEFPDRRKDQPEYLKVMVSNNKANCTLSAITYSNETMDTIYAPPVDVGKYKLFIKTPTSEASWSSLGNVFRPDLWVSIAVAFVFMSLVLICIEHLGYKAKIPKYLEAPADTGQLFIIILGNFCYQGGLNIASGLSGRVVLFTGLMTGYLVYVSYSTLVISQLTAVKVVPPFETLQEMSTRDTYKLFVTNEQSLLDDIEQVRKNKSNALASTWDRLLPPKLGQDELFNDEIQGIRKLCTRDAAILALDTKMTTSKQNKAKCSASPLKATYFSTYMGFILNKNNPYNSILIKTMNQMREVGILHRLRKYWDFFDGLNQNAGKAATKVKVKPISLNTIYPVLLIVAGGVVVSIVVLIFEVILKTVDIYYTKKHRDTQAAMFNRRRKPSMPA